MHGDAIGPFRGERCKHVFSSHNGNVCDYVPPEVGQYRFRIKGWSGSDDSVFRGTRS